MFSWGVKARRRGRRGGLDEAEVGGVVDVDVDGGGDEELELVRTSIKENEEDM